MRNATRFVRRSVSLTPLIDVIFLLLLFFMLSSTFSKHGEIELRQAAAGGAPSEPPLELSFVQLGADRLTLNGAPVSLEDLRTRPEKGQVLVSLDKDVSSQRLVDVLVQLRGRDGLDVTVLE